MVLCWGSLKHINLRIRVRTTKSPRQCLFRSFVIPCCDESVISEFRDPFKRVSKINGYDTLYSEFSFSRTTSM